MFFTKLNNSNRFKTSAFLAVCLTAAVLLRLPYANGVSSYDNSERLRDLAITASIGAGDTVNLGPPSCLGGFSFGPLYYYLMYPIAELTGYQPYSLALTSLLFSLATIILAYWTARRWWKDPRIAYLVVLIMSFSCLDWQFAKYASNPNFVAFFSLLMMHSYERLINGDKRPWLWSFLAGLSLSAAMQLHAIPLLALPFLSIMLAVIYRNRLKTLWLIPFAAGGLLVSAPYLDFEVSTGFANLGALLNLGLGSASPSGRPYLARIPDYLTFWVSEFISGHLYFSVFYRYGLAIVAAAGFYLTPLILLVHIDRTKPVTTDLPTEPAAKPNINLLLIIWLIAVTTVLFFPSSSVRGLYYYYFTSILPLVHFLLALGFYWLYSRGFWRTGLYLGLGWFLIQLWQVWVYQSYIASFV